MTENADPAKPAWRPLPAVDRRVVGVLAEKAKTTPDVYPMTLNGIVVACNQKSNRFPLMQLANDDVEESLMRLRQVGAAAEVHGSGRVLKYQHYLYDWLGVDRPELAVMTELLLRGAQTEGELRSRVERMEPIADLNALRPILDSLKAKGLVIGLTPAGRGHAVTHALYEPRELEQIQSQFAAGAVSGEPHAAHSSPHGVATPIDTDAASALRQELVAVQEQVARLRADLDDAIGRMERTAEELQRLKDALGA